MDSAVRLVTIESLDPVVAQQVVSKVLHRVEHFLARRDDLLFGKQKSVGTGIAQLDLITEMRTHFVVEPVDGRTAARFDALPKLVTLRLVRSHCSLARRCDRVRLPVGYPYGLGDSRRNL